MGHNHLAKFPNTRPWNAIVEKLVAGAPAEEIAGATASAAERVFAHAANDKGFQSAFFLLTQLPLAARSPEYLARMRELGVHTGPDVGLLALGAAFQEALDRSSAQTKRKTDLGEIARLAATDTLVLTLSHEFSSALETTGEDVRRALGKFAAPDHFARLSRAFFARLMQHSLEYFVSRVIADHVGPGRGFQSVADKAAFQQALSLHCFNAAAVVEQLSRDWYSKSNWQGGVTRAKSSGFARKAFRELRDELRQRVADG